MIPFTNSLHSELEFQLGSIVGDAKETIANSEAAIKILIEGLQKLKSFTLKYKFQDKAEEIHFFKAIKPNFVQQLIYHNEIYTIESNRPQGGEKAIRKYLNNELKKLKAYFDGNIEFYRYYRTGNCYLDKKYFLRGKHDFKFTPDSYYYDADQRFSTSHDFKIAKIMANDLIQVYLESELIKLELKNEIQQPSGQPVLKWTASKINLVELVYALHAEGVLNNGRSDLKEMVRFFEEAFDVDLGQFHRTFFEMRARKSERTKFLNSLRETLGRRMDEVDE